MVAISKPEALVLHAVSALDAATRKSIADFTSMSLVTVSAALNALQEGGVLLHEARSKEGGGRPTFYYSFSPAAGSFLGVSINQDSFRVVRIGADGSISLDESYELLLSAEPSAHANEIVEQVSRVVRTIAGQGNIPVLGAGVTLPGVTDSKNGVWVEGFEVTGVSHINIRDPLADNMGIPVWIEDPARATAFYELKRGIGIGCEDFVLIYLGSGVGGGIVVNGRLYRGRSGLAAEIGHIVVDPSGSRCTCGDIGCFETIASSRGILRAVQERLDDGVISSLDRKHRSSGAGMTMEDVQHALENNDRLAESVMSEVASHTAHVCAITIKLLNPGLVIISGEASVLARHTHQQIIASVRSRVIPSLFERCTIEFADFTVQDEALGVALFASDSYWATKVEQFNDGCTKQVSIEMQDDLHSQMSY